MSKFKIGQKVKCVEPTGMSKALVEGNVYTVRETFNGTTLTLEETGATQEWFETRFVAVEEEAVAAKPEPNWLVISYNGMNVVFDPSVAAGKKLVDKVIEEIYNMASA